MRRETRALPWERIACVLWLIALLAVAGRVAVRPGKGSVFPTFARAGAAWRTGSNFYLLTDLDKVSCNAFRYSPLVATFFVPFDLLPAPVGEVLWRVLNAGVLLGGALGWVRGGVPRKLTRAERGALLLLLLPLAVGNLNNGQSNPLVLGLLLLTVTAAARSRWNLAGLCLAAACLFKLYPIAVGLLLAAVYPQRFAGRLVGFLALGLVLPFLLQRPPYVLEQYADWFRYLSLDDRTDWAAEFGYRDLSLLFRVYLTPLTPRLYLAIQLAAAAAAAVLCVIARRAGWRRRSLLTGLLALGCGWMTVFGSATESATYVLLAPSLCLALVLAWREAEQRPQRIALLVSYGLFLATQLANWFPGGATRVQSLGPQPAAALVLLAVVVAGWRRTVLPSPPRGWASDPMLRTGGIGYFGPPDFLFHAWIPRSQAPPGNASAEAPPPER